MSNWIRENNNHPISFDLAGNLTDLITNEKGYMKLPELIVKPKKPETSDLREYETWLIREANRGGKNFDNNDKQAYDNMMTRLANQNETNNFVGYNGKVYQHGNGALGREYPELDLIMLGGLGKSLLKGITNTGLKLVKKPRFYNSVNNFNFSEPLKSKDFKFWSQPNDRTTVTLFKDVPGYKNFYTVDEMLSSLRSKYKPELLSEQDSENYKMASELGKELGITPSVETEPRYTALQLLKHDAKLAGSLNPKIYGIVSGGGGKYDGLILGRASKPLHNISDLIEYQAKNLHKHYPISKEESELLSNYVATDLQSVEDPLLYYSDKDSFLNGYYDPSNGRSFINVREIQDPKKIESTYVHERESHGSDASFNDTPVHQEYKNELNKLNLKDPEIEGSLKEQELRALKNEHKKKIIDEEESGILTPELKQEALEYGVDIRSNEELINEASKLNGYGQNYATAYRKLSPEKQRSFMETYRKNLKYLPIVFPFLMKRK